MELTIGELREAQGALVKILVTEQPFKLAYRLKKIIGKVEAELREIEAVRVKMVEKYGKVQPNGGLKVTDENLETFNKEMKEINEMQTSLDVQPIPLELLEGVRLSPLEVMRLEKFIEEPVGAGVSPAQKEDKDGQVCR